MAKHQRFAVAVLEVPKRGKSYYRVLESHASLRAAQQSAKARKRAGEQIDAVLDLAKFAEEVR